MLGFLWPQIQDIEDANKAARGGAGVAFFVSLVTGVVVYLHQNGTLNLLPQVGPHMYIDAGIFFVIGLGLLWRSRIAALAGLGLYAFGQYWLMKSGGRFSFAAIIFSLAFINAARGTFAYHELKKSEKDEERLASAVRDPSAPPLPPGTAAPSEEKKRGGRFKKILIALVLIVIIAAAAAALHFTGALQIPDLPFKLPWAGGHSQEPETLTEDSAEEPLTGESRSFKLRSGEVVKGVVIYEDETYYTVKTTGGREVYVIKEDIRS